LAPDSAQLLRHLKGIRENVKITSIDGARPQMLNAWLR
jgi:hypothetical protein